MVPEKYMREAREYIEFGKQINHRSMPWLDISRIDSKIEEKKGWKIHVSIHPGDYDKLAPVLAKIMEYRDRYGVGAKFAAKGWAEEMVNHETQRGKTVTVYVPEEQKAVAPRIVREIEEIIEREGIRTHLPAPNDEIVGKTGAIGVAYAHFGGGDLEVRDGFKHIYGEVIKDRDRRKDPRLAVPVWKEKEFHELFGKVPLNVAVFKALKAMGYSDKEAFRKLLALNLLKNEHRTGEKTTELKPGTVVTIKGADAYRLTHPERKKSETLLAPFAMFHGGWQSRLGAPAYVLSSKGYVKVTPDGAKLRKAREAAEHLHDDPHIVVERLPGILRIYNVGKETVKLERVEL